MEAMTRITPEQETEFRMMTTEMFKQGGTLNVLACIKTMQQVQIIILKKLNELLEEEKLK